MSRFNVGECVIVISGRCSGKVLRVVGESLPGVWAKELKDFGRQFHLPARAVCPIRTGKSDDDVLFELLQDDIDDLNASALSIAKQMKRVIFWKGKK